MGKANLDLLKEQLSLLVQEPGSFQCDELQRTELLRLSRRAANALETPQEMTQRIIFSVSTYVRSSGSQNRLTKPRAITFTHYKNQSRYEHLSQPTKAL